MLTMSFKALLEMPRIPVALPFKSFLIILVTCETEIGLNLNLQLVGGICPVSISDSVYAVGISMASVSLYHCRLARIKSSLEN